MSMFEIALAEAWAMRPDALEMLLAIADRANNATPEALEAYRAETARNGEKLRVRDDVAIIDIAGPLFKKANLFQAMSGASSYSVMARDLQQSLDDTAIKGIMLHFDDSPGGTVSGCDELATAIFRARGIKPIISYVSGGAHSAAYWLASAGDKIILSDSSSVGSIGVVFGFEDRTEANAKAGRRTIEFVSSNAPGKRPNYDTDEGKALIQRRVDDLEAVFIAAVAKHRGVDAATVMNDFGKGGVEIGANAVKLKMADELGTFEDAFAQLSRGTSRRSPQRSKGSSLMSENQGAPTANDVVITQADVDKAAAKARTDATARIQAIVTSPEAKGREKLANHLAYSTDMTAEQAVATLTAADKPTAEKEPEGDEFLKRKGKAGSLGFGEEAGGDPAGSGNVMMGAVARINGKSK